MFRKLKSSFTSGSKGSVKVRFDVTVESVVGLDGVQACRVVWARQSKVQVTRQALVQQGVASWHEELSQIGTLDRDTKGNYLPKEYVLKLQCPDRSASGKFNTVGKLAFDMAGCVGGGTGKPQKCELRVPLGGRGAGRGVALLTLGVAATLVRSAGEGSEDEGPGLGIDDEDDDTSLVSDDEDDDEDNARALGRSPAGAGLSPARKPTPEALRELAARQQVAAATTAEAVASVGHAPTAVAAAGAQSAPPPAAPAAAPAPAPDTAVPGSSGGRPRVSVPGLTPGDTVPDLASPMPALGIAVKSDTFVPGGLSAMVAAESPRTISGGGGGKAPDTQAAAATTAAVAAAVAAAPPSTTAMATSQSVNDELARELSELRARLESAEGRATRAESEAAAAAARAATELSSTTARYEARVAQLLAAVESRGDAGELEQRLLAAEAEVGEAEALAGEAMALLESAQSENTQLRSALDAAKADAGFAAAQVTRERNAWETRLREAFRRVEDAVALAERAAEERDQAAAALKLLQDREEEREKSVAVTATAGAGGVGGGCSVTAASAGADDGADLQDPSQTETKISPPSMPVATVTGTEASAVALAARCAGLESELEAARRRIRAMEDAVERAEAARVAAEASIVDGSAMPGTEAGDDKGDGNPAHMINGSSASRATSTDNEAVEAERAAALADELDALRLELEFVRSEAARLRGELESAAREAAIAMDAAAREAAALRGRCGELAREAEVAREAAAAARAETAAAEGRTRSLEAKLRLAASAAGGMAAGGIAAATTATTAAASPGSSPARGTAAPLHGLSPLAAAALARGGPLAAASAGTASDAASGASGPVAAAVSPPATQQQQSTEALELLNTELTSLSAAMASLTAERDSLESRLRGVESEFAAQQASLALAQERVAAREAQLAALEELQAGLLVNGSGVGASGAVARRIPARSSSAAGDHADEGDGASSPTTGEDMAAARELAAFSASELAGALTSLAEAQAERRDLGAKLTELRGQVVALRAGGEGELRARIESLERDLLAARARADVDALLREEHDRLAADLVATKLVWAQGQESLVKLRRALAKSQEKSMSFASKLTRLETRLYAKVKSTMKDIRRGGGSNGAGILSSRSSS